MPETKRDNGRIQARIALALLIAGMSISLAWTVNHEYDPSDFDSGTYIATARSLLNGEGYSYAGQPFILRPPGLSVLLVPILALGGGFWWMNLLGGLFGMLASALLFVYTRERLGILIAFVLALSFWLNPFIQSMCNRVMSDVPGAALMMGVLLIERRTRDDTGLKGTLLLGLAIGATAYVRLIYLLIVPAIILSRVLSQPRKGSPGPKVNRAALACIALVPLLMLVPWKLRNAIVSPPPPSIHTANYSYSSATWNVDSGDPNSERLPYSEVAARIVPNLELMVAGIGSGLSSNRTARPRSLSVGAIALAALIWSLFRRREPADFLVLGMLAIFCITHTTAVRLVIPVYLIALPAVLDLITTSIRLVAGSAAGRLAGFVVVAAILTSYGMSEREAPLSRRHSEFTTIANYITDQLPAEAKLASWDGGHLAAYIERPVLGLGVVSKSDDRGGPKAAIDLIGDQDIEFVVIRAGTRTSNSKLPYREDPGLGPRQQVLVELLRSHSTVAKELGPWIVFEIHEQQDGR